MSEDKFEASEMHDGSPILHRAKRVTRRMAALIAFPGAFTIALAIFIAIINGSSAKPLPATALPFVVAALIAFGLFLFGMALTFAVLRTLVTEQAVHVKYGLWGPTIPLSSIKKCTVVEYDWTEFGGWGLRYGRNNSRAYVPSSGPVVEILYDDGGVARRVLIGVNDASLTAAEINRAREKALVRVDVGTGVRVDATGDARTASAGEEMEEDREAEESAEERGAAER